MNFPAIRKLFLYTCLCITLSACSGFGSKKPNPELASTIVRSAAKYLVHVVNSHENEINGAILWVDLLKAKKMTKDQYRFQFRSLRARFPKSEGHPLIGLNIQDLEWTGDEAEVHFVNSSGTPKDIIKVHLMWSGSGWLVDEDSLFGRGKQIENWTGVKITEPAS